MFILDTDSITHDQKEHPILIERVRTAPREDLFTTSVTIEEQLKGRLAFLHRERNHPHRSAQGHGDLVQTIFYFSKWNVLLYTEDADALFRRLRKQRIRIGSQDLRIAAIALLHGFTVVTSNRRDFNKVPNLKVEDWTTPLPSTI
jgi:tRNA(fMet)-specific endonuclease VapC